MHFRSTFIASTSVTPDPQKQSNTVSPGPAYRWICRETSSDGFRPQYLCIPYMPLYFPEFDIFSSKKVFRVSQLGLLYQIKRLPTTIKLFYKDSSLSFGGLFRSPLTSIFSGVPFSFLAGVITLITYIRLIAL